MEGRAARAGCIALLSCIPFALYGGNLDDYFVGDDFDFLVSLHEKPPRYFFELLYSNEAGDVWKHAGFDAAEGRGYLRPVKIWLLEGNVLASGTDPFGYHLTSTLVFSGLAVMVFLLADRLLPGRRHYALLAATLTAIHPTFAEVVPFITARDEALAALFSVAALHAFVRFRQSGASPLAFYAFYALALLSKESAFLTAAMAFGYDLVCGAADPRTREGRRAALKAHGPILLLLAAYFGLRLIAFGNVKGGDVAETSFLSIAAAVRFHSWFLRSLVAPSQLALPFPAAVAALSVLAAVGAAGFIWLRGDRRRYGPLLLFVGPVWYLGATGLLHGTYFTTRHHGMAVIGLFLTGAVLLSGATERWSIARQRALAAALAGIGILAFVPPAYALSRSYDAASGVVARVRQAIDDATAHLPDGCAVRILNVPQHTERPWYFGWGLRSALSRPFTASDLANRCTVINPRNLALTNAPIAIPERFDLVLDLAVVPTGPAP
jgi:hypothetical protein